MSLLSYSSGLDACGINDYNRHLMAAFATLMPCETVRFPTRRVTRDQVRPLLAFRREYRALAARSDAFDAVLVHYVTRFFNGGRLVENMLPLFLGRLHKPAIMVLHEWPTISPPYEPTGSWPARLAKRALTSAWLARDLHRVDYARWVERDMFRAFAHIIVHTPDLRDALLAADVAASRISVQQFPLHELPAPAWTAEEAREKFRLRDRRALLILGHPVPRKGFEVAVRALAKLPADVALVLVCSDADPVEREAVEKLRVLARAAGVGDRFITTGFLDDAQLAALFSAITLALSPFISVSGSSSLAHFLAAGLPVVASDLPAIRRTAEHGAGVALVTAGDADALAATIETTLATRLAELRTANRRYANTNTFLGLARAIHDLVPR